MAIDRFIAAGDHHRGAHRERQLELEHGDVEGQRGDGHQHVIGSQAGLARHAGEEVDHRAVRHHHALGLAGGAGGVDHVGRILGTCVQGGIRRQPLIRLRGERAAASMSSSSWRSRGRPKQPARVGRGHQQRELCVLAP